MSDRKKTRFATRLSAALSARQMGQKGLAEQMGTSVQYVSAIASGKKRVSPSRIDDIAGILQLDDVRRSALHRAAAADLGFRLDLPEDFTDPQGET